MPSPAERRVPAGRALRAAALLALAWLVWITATAPRLPHRIALSGAALGAELPRWTMAPQADTLALRLMTPPPPAQRDWLLALRRAGTAVTWSGAITPLAVDAAWSADPVGVLTVRVAAPRGDSVVLADSLGRLGAATASAGGAAFALPPGSPWLRASAAASHAAAAVTPRPPARRVAVLGPAGWETKFVIAALEERGWLVDARVTVAPGRAVTQGAPWPPPPDTARHAAVVLLDSVPAREAAALAAYVRRGGGLVVGPAAARVPPPALRELLPAAAFERVRAAELAVSAADPRAALPVDRLTPGPFAATLERRAAGAVVAARRWYAGRVVQVGYDDSWRWRLAGEEGAPDDHRAWWSALVSAAAAEPAGLPSPTPSPADPAPLASLVLALGPAQSGAAETGGSGPGSRGAPAAFAVFLAALLAEWASRRLRGAA